MQSDFKELYSHAKFYISADLFSKGLSFLSIPIFTRLLLIEEYGILSVYTSYVGLFTIIFGLGFRGAVTRFYYDNQREFFSFLASNFWFLVISGTVLSLLLVSFKNYLRLIFNIPIPMMLIGVGVIFLTSLIELFQSYFIAAKRSKSLSVTTIVQGLSILSLSVLLMLNLGSERYYGRAIAELVAVILLIGYFLFDFGTRNKFRINRNEVKYSLLFGIPIVFHLLAQSVLNFFDQVIINQLVGPKETGIYALAYKVGMIQSIISMGVLKAWTPFLYAKLNSKEYSSIEKLANKNAWIIGGVGVCLILFSKEIIILLADPSFNEAEPIVPIVVIGYLFFFLYSMYIGFAFYNKSTKLMFLFTLIAGAINVGLNYLLIPQYGIVAAAWTTVFAFLCLFILHYINVKFIIKFRFVLKLSLFYWPFFIVFIAYMLVKLSENFAFFNELIFRIVVALICLYISYRNVKETV